MLKTIVFDMDGTLTPSKSPLERPMGKLLTQLLRAVRVGVISGAEFPQFQRQFLKFLPKAADLSNLFILPMNGSELWEWKKGKWHIRYRKPLTPAARKKIKSAFKDILKMPEHKPKKTYGKLLDDRGCQITFSGLGSDAPLKLKSRWDPDQKKRKRMKKLLDKKLKDFEITIGGTTSIDVTRKGITKAYGVRQALRHYHGRKRDEEFVGDALFAGGNDYPVKKLGIRTVKVSGPRETARFIQKIRKT